mmetsp:Transcript_13124/g.31075  ORF Transcript_13124/g.31075 Transcript_13124/m.31075 type:complete len:112 (+) Transcript_13124:1552-1887(+)
MRQNQSQNLLGLLRHSFAQFDTVVFLIVPRQERCRRANNDQGLDSRQNGWSRQNKRHHQILLILQIRCVEVTKSYNRQVNERTCFACPVRVWQVKSDSFECKIRSQNKTLP